MVFRIEKNQNYTTMSNYHLRDKNLSLKAKGLLSLMLSLPDDWNYSLKGLVTIVKESESAIKSTLTELKTFGYVVVNKVQDKKGRFDYEYNIFEYPTDEKPMMENPPMEEPPLEVPKVENPIQINTNKQNTDNKTPVEATPQTSVARKSKENVFEVSVNGNIELLQALKDFEESRTKNKSKMTDRAKKLLISRLKELSDNPNVWIKMLENAILNGWKTVYELKENEKVNYVQNLVVTEPTSMPMDYGYVPLNKRF